MHYILQIAQGMLDILSEGENLTGKNVSGRDDINNKLRLVVTRCAVLVEEMKRLDPRDFLPDARYEFVLVRSDLDLWSKRWSGTGEFVNQFWQDPIRRDDIREAIIRAAKVLGKYGGAGWRTETREFAFLNNVGLRDIVRRDYKELSLVLFPGGAWKSAVVMAGSILEAVLFDRLDSPLI